MDARAGPAGQPLALDGAAGEEVAEGERRVARARVVGAVPPPLVERPVPRELDVVTVRIAQVDGEVRPVVCQLTEWDSRVDEPADGLGELLS
jgi:hypothetical protein